MSNVMPKVKMQGEENRPTLKRPFQLECLVEMHCLEGISTGFLCGLMPSLVSACALDQLKLTM